MQVLKKEVRERILKSALEEFEEKGFQKASMRNIASDSGVAVGNLYNYFGNKDDLFSAVMEPVTEPVREYFRIWSERDLAECGGSWSYHIHKVRAGEMARFLERNRRLLVILFFKSHGSSLEMFTDSIIEEYTDLTMCFLERARELIPEIRSDISRFTVHSISSYGMSSVRELLMHGIPFSEMESYLQENMKFMYYGWQAIMECDFEKLMNGRE